MATFVWRESYSVHVARLDTQHKILFDTVNSLADAVRIGGSQHVIRDAVYKLTICSRAHCLEEEVLMKEAGYPGLAVHKLEHRSFLAALEKYKMDLNRGRDPNTMAVLGL